MIEHEVKLEVDRGFVMPDPAGDDMVVESMSDLDLDAIYYDAADCRLLDAGVTVRRRTGEGTRWTVKTPAPGPAEAGTVSRDEADFVTADESVPAPVLDAVAPFIAGGELVAVASLRSRRRRWSVRLVKGGVIAEIDDDTVVAISPDAPTLPVEFRELEIEYGPGVEPAHVRTIVDGLVAAGARLGGPMSKLERALALLGRR